MICTRGYTLTKAKTPSEELDVEKGMSLEDFAQDESLWASVPARDYLSTDQQPSFLF